MKAKQKADAEAAAGDDPKSADLKKGDAKKPAKKPLNAAAAAALKKREEVAAA